MRSFPSTRFPARAQISEDLRAAIASEDFERAHALKQRRDALQAAAALPEAVTM